MKTKLQIKSIFGKLLFEFETENNSMAKTIDKAVSVGANLQGANLEGARLDYCTFKLRCGFGFAKTSKCQRMQLIAHVASFFKNSQLSAEETELYDSMKNYCKNWHREDEFGEL